MQSQWDSVDLHHPGTCVWFCLWMILPMQPACDAGTQSQSLQPTSPEGKRQASRESTGTELV